MNRVDIKELLDAGVHFGHRTQRWNPKMKPYIFEARNGIYVIDLEHTVKQLEAAQDFLRDIAASGKRTLFVGCKKQAQETIKDLAKKDYPAQFPGALDHVVLFLPAESLFSAALEADRDLILWAAQRQIMLATPASLIALLRAVSVSWQQHAQTENAREISEAAQELFNRVATFSEHFEKIRAGLERANAAFDAAVGSYQRMVRPSGEKLLKLGGGNAAKELADIAPLDATLRLPSA